MSRNRSGKRYLTKRVKRNLEIQERIRVHGRRSYKGFVNGEEPEKLDVPTEKERKKLMKQKLKAQKRADKIQKKQKKQENKGK